MKEADPHRLAQRQKQIDYGRNTEEYDLYEKFKARGILVPNLEPPDKTQIRSKRSWDGLVRQWRRWLHTWYDRVKEIDRIKSDNEYQAYLEYEASGISVPFPDYKYSEAEWNVIITNWKADLNAWYFDSYVFIPVQYKCKQCNVDAGFRELTGKGFIFCGVECQRAFHKTN